MTADTARLWLISMSLGITGLVFVFFLVAPVTGYPLEWANSLRALEIVVPVFLGYLGTSAQFVFRNLAGAANHGISPRASNRFLGLLTIGPVVVFLIAVSALVVAFGVSNRPTAPPNSGMNVDQFAAGITAALGLLTVTTNVAVSYLFSLDGKPVAVGAPQTRAAKREG